MGLFRLTKRTPSEKSRSASSTPTPSDVATKQPPLPDFLLPWQNDADETIKATRPSAGKLIADQDSAPTLTSSADSSFLDAPPAPKPSFKSRFSDAWAIPTPRGSISTIGSQHLSSRPSTCSILSKASDFSRSENIPGTHSRRSSVNSSYDLRTSDRRSSVEQTLSAFSFDGPGEASPRKSHRTEPYVASLLSQRRSSAQLHQSSRRDRLGRRATINPLALTQLPGPQEGLDIQSDLDSGLQVTVV